MAKQRFKLKQLTGQDAVTSNTKYKVINSVQDFEDGYTSLFVKTLDPDYYMLFNSIRLIITEHGSSLSHLAIVGREYNIPIFLVENIISKIPKKGILSIKNNMLEVETK
ncbi:MAG: PEP-utilizing enzyme [Candidatus Woesearchaeota archaeon]